MGRRKNYNPKNKGKRSYQPILTFLAETREYLMGGYAVDDRPSGKEIVAHPESAFRALPAGVKKIFARADAGFCCREAGGGSLPTSALSVRHRSAQDAATGRTVVASRMEVLASQRR